MFLFDLIISDVMGQIVDWVYGQIIGFLVGFFEIMGNMGVELFELQWSQSIILFFSRLGWALYLVGLVVAVFECGIEYQSGRGSVKDVCLNAIKGFMAVSLFSDVPVKLYTLSVNLQGQLSDGLTGSNRSLGDLANDIVSDFGQVSENGLMSDIVNGLTPFPSPILLIFIIIMVGYAVIKVFFANLKRGGILLTQICVGSLYMFSIPRGYGDGFVQWSKQIIALCFTTFMQATILTAGLMILLDNPLIGLGLMLSATEIPRIAEAFGLETSTKVNVMGSIYSAQTAVNLSKTVLNAVTPAKVP